jgi:GntR family transcriptional repressor for pyruvate dehydrogenase complex
VVAPISSADLGETLTFFMQASGTTLREVMTARLILEPIMARLTAERSGAEVEAALQASIDSGRGVLKEGDEQHLEDTTDFHGFVSGASGNSVLDLLTRSLNDIYVARVRFIMYEPEERPRLLRDHEVVAEAFMSGEAIHQGSI